MTDQPARLGRDVFLALAAIGWADGNLDPEEAEMLVNAIRDTDIRYKHSDEYAKLQDKNEA